MLGRSVGLTNAEIAAMGEAENSPVFDPTDRLVLRYSTILTLENRVPDDLYAELAGRFTKDELVELCFTVALAALVNRVHATFRTDVDGSTTDSAAISPSARSAGERHPIAGGFAQPAATKTLLIMRRRAMIVTARGIPESIKSRTSLLRWTNPNLQSRST
jgi:hypothetical protein